MDVIGSYDAVDSDSDSEDETDDLVALPLTIAHGNLSIFKK